MPSTFSQMQMLGRSCCTWCTKPGNVPSEPLGVLTLRERWSSCWGDPCNSRPPLAGGKLGPCE
eukprot:3399618-Prorocentrum_lima.AAC.1